MSRPSVKACSTTSSAPSRRASSTAPAGGPCWRARRRRRRGRAGAAAGAAQAASSTSFSKNEPSSMASSMRVRSCLTTAPAPRLRWPTSELPIWPSGRPTARPQAVRVVCGYGAQSSSKTGVSASSTALPGPGSARPQPSSTTRQTRGRRLRGRAEAHWPAAATICAKPSGSRLAPPTSAPSTSGWARISAALSGLTLPP